MINNVQESYPDYVFLSDVTNTYCIFIGAASTKDYNMKVYKVINKETGVIEAELSMLPRAYQYCLELEQDLSQMEHELAGRHADFLSDIEASSTEH